MWNLPRVVWAVAVGRFFTSASSFLMLFLTLYLTGPRGLGVVAAGLLTGTSGVGWLAGNFTGGRWGDRHGHRRTALVASTGSGLLVATIPLQPVWLMAVTLPVSTYLSATAGVSLGALDRARCRARQPAHDGRRLAGRRSNAGFVIGPPVGALLAAWSYDALFVVDGLMLLAVRVVLAPLLPHQEPPPEDAPTTGFLTALRADRALLRLLPAVVVVDLVYRQLYTTVPLHLRDEGMPLGLYAAITAVGSGLILLLEVPVALRLRGFSSYPIIAAGYALVGVGFALFGLPVSAATAVLAMVVLTAGEILYKTTATAHVLDAAPDHLVGQYQGLYGGASTSGSMLAGPVGGAIYAFAPALLWPLCGIAALGAAASVLVVSSRGSLRRAKPGRYSSRIARNGASASSWLSTPMPPSQVRWISRYDGGRFSFMRDRVRRLPGVVDALELRAHPLPGEPELLHLGRLDERREVVEQQVGVDPDPVLDEPLVAQAGHERLAVLDGGDPDQPAHRRRAARRLGQPGDGAEVEHPEPAGRAVLGREDPEVARVRVGVQHAGARRAGEQEPHEQLAVVVALLLGALADDRGQRVRALQPLGDQHVVALTRPRRGRRCRGRRGTPRRRRAAPRPRAGSRAPRRPGPAAPRPAA